MIIDELVKRAGTALVQEDTDSLTAVHIGILNIHTKALACHCECLGLNTENSWAVCNNSAPPFNQGHHREIMQKWGLIDEKGNPII